MNSPAVEAKSAVVEISVMRAPSSSVRVRPISVRQVQVELVVGQPDRIGFATEKTQSGKASPDEARGQQCYNPTHVGTS